MQLFSFLYHKGTNRCSTIQQNSLFYIIFHSIYHISVRGVREELQPFTLIFYFFLSIFSNKIDTNVRNPPSHPSHFLFFFFKNVVGNPKNTTVFFRFPATFSNQLPGHPRLFKIPFRIIFKLSGALFLLIRNQRLHTKHFPIFRTYDIYHIRQRAESLFAVRYSVIRKTTVVDSRQHYGNVLLRVTQIFDCGRRMRFKLPNQQTD